MDVPEIISVRSIAQSRLFHIEELDLMFSNGEQRTYERLAGGRRSAVIVVALNEQDELMLIKEYAAGFHEIQLSLVKGAADSGESLKDAANRELQEEIGYGAKSIQHLKSLTIAPGHMGFTIDVLLATELYVATLEGDEPEPPELVTWPVDSIDELIASPEFCEARAIAALCLARPMLSHQTGRKV